mmetsp:Transcript_101884/g.287474  ORF Transcript_101884/g.287474 Transcript_101884/m.287474 type:complete len:135 (+) Transcript_101884:169-573(+)
MTTNNVHIKAFRGESEMKRTESHDQWAVFSIEATTREKDKNIKVEITIDGGDAVFIDYVTVMKGYGQGCYFGSAWDWDLGSLPEDKFGSAGGEGYCLSTDSADIDVSGWPARACYKELTFYYREPCPPCVEGDF